MNLCTRCVLTALWNNADENGIVTLTNRDLMCLTHYGSRSVEYAIRYLRGSGEIEVAYKPKTAQRIIKVT